MSSRERAVGIVKTLQTAGYQAYFVGGSVRDLLLGKTPKDYDIVTDATPDEVGVLFKDVHEVGKQFGVLMVSYDEGEYEVATFRGETKYSDKRRPDEVYWSSAAEDVKRRDFTINGLLFDPVTEKVKDYVEGQRDLENHVIRFIGDPSTRVAEDPLRILRAIRIKTALGFQYDKATFEAIRAHAADITHVSSERVGHELNLMFAHKNRLQAFKDLERTGLLAVILPEVEALKGTPQPVAFHEEGDVYDHVVRALETLPANAPAFLTWAVMLHDVAKPETLKYYQDRAPGKGIRTYGHAKQSAFVAEQVLRRLRLSKTEIETISWLIAHHMSLKEIDAMRPSKREQYVLDPRFPWLLELHHADAAGAVPVDLSLYEKSLKLYEKLKADHQEQLRSKPKILVDGYDLQRELKLDPGPKIGELLEHIRDAQLNGQLSTRAEAIDYARQLR